jgi:hypothetical protein
MDDKPRSRLLPTFLERVKNITQRLESSRSTISLNLDRASENSLPHVEQHQPNKPKAGPTSEPVRRSSTKTPGENGPAPRLPDRVPGNYYSFDFLVEITNKGETYIGHPCVAIRDVVSGQTSWGADVKYLAPTSAIARTNWIDDPEKGISQRELYVPEDLIGAAGIIGGKRCFCEQILHLGNDIVVYSIYCHDQQFRLAYGFRRNMFITQPNLPILTGST